MKLVWTKWWWLYWFRSNWIDDNTSGDQRGSTPSTEIQDEVQAQDTSVSISNICCCLWTWRTIEEDTTVENKPWPSETEIHQMHTDRPQTYWRNVLWTDQAKLEQVPSSLCSDANIKPAKRRRLYQHGEGSVRLYSFLEQNVLPSSRRLGLSHGSPNKTMTQTPQLKTANWT